MYSFADDSRWDHKGIRWGIQGIKWIREDRKFGQKSVGVGRRSWVEGKLFLQETWLRPSSRFQLNVGTEYAWVMAGRPRNLRSPQACFGTWLTQARSKIGNAPLSGDGSGQGVTHACYSLAVAKLDVRDKIGESSCRKSWRMIFTKGNLSQSSKRFISKLDYPRFEFGSNCGLQ